MGRENKQIIRLAFFLLFIAACKKDKPAPLTTPPTFAGNDVYIVCEGSLGNGNASLSLYDAAAKVSYEDVYKTANNNQSLGDVFQSMVRIGDKLFLCINNSDKVLVINHADHKLAGTISVPKPRYILPINETKAYVSTLFSNKVYIINPSTYTVTGSFPMPYQNPEGMLLFNNNAYICTWDTACSKLYKVNTATDKIEQEIDLAGKAPQEVLPDANNKLWVLSGNVTKGKKAALTCVEPGDGHIIHSFVFPDKADVIRPVFNKAKNTLYFIEVNYSGGTDFNGVYRMDIGDNQLPAQPFLAAQQYQYFWALGIDPRTDNIYIGDPKGFVQKGSVSVYDAGGIKTTSFEVGIGPGHFYFNE